MVLASLFTCNDLTKYSTKSIYYHPFTAVKEKESEITSLYWLDFNSTPLQWSLCLSVFIQLLVGLLDTYAIM